MKKFVLHIAALALLTLLIMAVLDFGYTYAYAHAKPRSKYQLLRSYKNQNFDFAFLGSSRVLNTVMPSVIQKRTGKRAINLGFKAANLQDIYTVLKLLKAYNIKTDEIFIQVDNYYNLDEKSNIVEYQIMPFIRENSVTKAHFEKYCDLPLLYYLPFYRYCAYDQKIGIREVFNNLIGKGTTIDSDSGFQPEYGHDVDNKYALPAKINKGNVIFDSIQKYSAAHHLDVFYFCAPFYKETRNLDFITKLKGKVPGLLDYSNIVTDGKMFQNNSHVNEIGAEYFTNCLVEDLYRRKIIDRIR